MNSLHWSNVIEECISKIENMTVSCNTLDEVYSELCTSVFTEMDSFLKFTDRSKRTRKKFKNFKPYWSDALTESWRDMADAEKKYKSCKISPTKKHFRTLFLEKQAKFDKLLRNTERTYNRQLADMIEDLDSENPKKFWEQIKKLGPKKSKNLPMQVYDPNGALISDTETVLHVWKQEFSNLYNVPDDSGSDFDNDFYERIKHEKRNMERHYDQYPEHSDLNNDVSIQEVNNATRRLKDDKATGCDEIPNEILKRENLSPILRKFMNVCFVHGVTPTVWQQAIISPIPKSSSKDPYVPLNYRGISLLSCVYKLYSSIINKRLVKHLESNDLIVDEQNGFRAGRSCLDHVYVLSSIIRNRQSQGLPTFTAFVDMQKAFDWVNRDLLLFKLMSQFNISGRMYKAIASLYTNSSACVRLNSHSTASFDINSGVKQGDPLSPTLFSMFLNDLALDVKSLNCGVNIDGTILSILMFADDIALIAPDEASLQAQLDAIYNWCRKWRMAVNKSKTQVVHFRPSRHPITNFSFLYGTEPLSKVSEYKYLGVYFDEYLKFTSNAKTLSSAGSRALGLLRYKLKYLKECGCSTYTKLFSSCVCPIIDYCAGAWGTKKYECIEKVQLNALRYFLGVHKFVPIDMLYGDSGWITSFGRHKLAMLRLWNRLISIPPDRLTSHIFFWDLSFFNYSGTWSNSIRTLFNDLKLPNYFSEIIPIDLASAHAYILDRETRDWNLRRYGKPKLRYYNMIKSGIDIEEYLFYKIPKYHRSLFAQLRAGILPLNIETGRYKNVELSERLCTLCDDNLVEDEVHFLCCCRFYSDLRDTLYNHAREANPEFDSLDMLDKYVYLMSDLQKDTIAFVYQSVMRRKSALYQ